MKPQQNELTKAVAKQKAAAYCAYQERCKQELIQKFKQWQISYQDQQELLDWLEDENFLDEVRFAKSFVSGKFRNNRWGKVKIRQHLTQKRISSSLIEEALSTIEEEAYSEMLLNLYHQKLKELKPKASDTFQLKGKLYRFLLSRGFEPERISNLLRQME